MSDTPSLKDLIVSALTEGGYQALAGDECGCSLPDLMPCDMEYCSGSDCHAAYVVPCKGEDCPNRDEDDLPSFCEASYPFGSTERKFPDTCITTTAPAVSS